MAFPSSRSPDLLVVGGGIIGLAAALDAAARGLRVTILERDRAGGGATWAAAGMLSPVAEAEGGGPFLELGLRSLRMYGSWVAEVEERSGEGVEYRRCGKLLVGVPSMEGADLRERIALAASCGVHAELLGPDELRREAPGIASHEAGAVLLHEDDRVDNRALARALLAAARHAGIEVREGTAVGALLHDGRRVEGVALGDGGRVAAPRVLLAAGAWTGAIGGLPAPVPVRPVRGQMLSLRPATPLSTRVIEAAGVYLVPREDGRLLVGATVEEAGFREENTAEGVRALLEGALRAAPSLAGAPIREFWSGFRPGTPDGHPILGADPRIEGLLLATGHYRNGILLAPITARIVGALAAGEPGVDDPITVAFAPATAAG